MACCAAMAFKSMDEYKIATMVDKSIEPLFVREEQGTGAIQGFILATW